MGESIQCPVCKRPVRVNLDGQLRKHKGELGGNGPWRPWCPNRSPRVMVKADGAASGGRLTTPAGSGTVPIPAGSKLPSRPTPHPGQWSANIKDRVFSNTAARAAHEDAESRNYLVDRLIGLRRARSLTQVQIAARMGILEATISTFETENSDPCLSTVQRYARAVGADLILELRPREGDSDAPSAARRDA